MASSSTALPMLASTPKAKRGFSTRSLIDDAGVASDGGGGRFGIAFGRPWSSRIISLTPVKGSSSDLDLRDSSRSSPRGGCGSFFLLSRSAANKFSSDSSFSSCMPRTACRRVNAAKRIGVAQRLLRPTPMRHAVACRGATSSGSSHIACGRMCRSRGCHVSQSWMPAERQMAICAERCVLSHTGIDRSVRR